MAHQEQTADLTALEDEKLVSLCRAGHGHAWSTLVHRYKRLVYAVPVRAGLGDEDAEDVFQDVFAKLAERIDSIRDGGRIRAWIVTTTRRLTIDAIRSRKSRGVRAPLDALEQMPDDGEPPSRSVERRQECELIRRALLRLDPRSQRLLALLFSERDANPSYRAIAHELGIPTGSIGPTRMRCLDKLRLEYQRMAA